MIGLIKAVFGALGAIFGYFRDRQLINAGKAEQANDTAQSTLDAIAKVVVPITDADRQRVWNRLQAKRGPKQSLPTDPAA